MKKYSREWMEWWVEWLTNDPESAKKYYPELTEELTNRIRNFDPFVTASIIKELPTHFHKWKTESDNCLGITRKKMVQGRIDFINAVLTKYKFDHEIINVALESVRDELQEQLEYWKQELKTLSPKKTKKSPETPRLSVKQIALIHIYEEKQITRDNAGEIAAEHDYKAKYSGEGLFQDYSFYCSTANRKGQPTDCTKRKLTNKIKLFESIVNHLSDTKRQRATDEINILKTILEKEYS